jgi:hypothetical protein
MPAGRVDVLSVTRGRRERQLRLRKGLAVGLPAARGRVVVDLAAISFTINATRQTDRFLGGKGSERTQIAHNRLRAAAHAIACFS